MIRTLFSLLYSFGKIGIISLGGGNSMLKLIETEAVDYRHWINANEFVAMVGTSFLFPGLTAVKLCALIGYKTAGITGLIVSVLAINVPGLALSVVGYRFLSNHDTPFTHKIMVSVQYGALALLAAASYSVAQGVIGVYFSWPVVITTLLFFLALVYLQLSPFWGFIAFIGICFFLVR